MQTTPERVGSYVVEGELGRGGMGVVYAGRDERLGRKVALKTLPVELAASPERLSRLEREARTLASVSHPGIATIYALEQGDDGSRFLVLEYVEGRSFAETLGRGAMSLTEAFAVCRQIAEALASAHERGVIHRDLNPSNIMILPDGTVKLLDFGLAKPLRGGGELAGSHLETGAPNVTRPGDIMGTPQYMSPEQARGLAVDARSDIFSFGCVLYECLCGSPAFQGATSSDILARVLTGEPAWSALPPGTPGKALELLIRCLAKDADSRLGEASRAAAALEELIAETKPSSSRLAALEAPPTNLPAPVTAFVGRERELSEVASIMERSRRSPWPRRSMSTTTPGARRRCAPGRASSAELREPGARSAAP